MKKIFVNGTFDILHRGHLDLLHYAKSLGDTLLVAIDSDRRVKELKGDLRPINNELDRKYFLYSLKPVDVVMTFDSDKELENLIQEYSPDVMVKGSDYKDKPIIGSKYCKEILFVDLVNGYSTTNIIQRIINR